MAVLRFSVSVWRAAYCVLRIACKSLPALTRNTQYATQLLLCLLCGLPAWAATNAAPLAWDAISKDYTAQPGELAAHLYFAATNVSTQTVVIDSTKTSCGCTAAKMPATPWVLAPGEGGRLGIAVDLRGKTGTFWKTIEVQSTNAAKILTVHITVPPGTTNTLDPQMADRLWNREVAASDSRAIFRNECARCHFVPATARYAGNLFQAVCANCHESPRRATMVPDLRTLDRDYTPVYWKNIITHGKPGTFMPAFAAAEGGPLDDQQINTLIDFLLIKYHKPRKPAAVPPTAKPAAPAATVTKP